MEYAVIGGGDEAGPTPFQVLSSALDELVTAGVVPEVRRTHTGYPVWASVHGMAVFITQGPLRQLPDQLVSQLNEQLFQFITRGALVIRSKGGSGLGLVGMRERAELLGGRVVAGPDGGGWVVDCSLPLAKSQAANERAEEAQLT